MDEYPSESDSDYTSYWRDWVSDNVMQLSLLPRGANKHYPYRGRYNFILLFLARYCAPYFHPFS